MPGFRSWAAATIWRSDEPAALVTPEPDPALTGLEPVVLRQALLRLAPFPALFISAALIAFLLDIPRRWLQHRGVPRPLTMVLVLGVTVGVVVLSGLWLVPRLIEQLGELINAAPGWLEQAQNQLNVLQEKALERGIPPTSAPLTDDLLARSTRLARSLSQQLLGLLSATLGLTVNSIIVLVLAVFLLLGGETISAGLARWVPADWRELVVGSLNRTFRGYFAGQVLLALILSGLQVVVFTLLQIPYGILFALLIGFTTLIPYASALTITLISIVLTVEDLRTGLEVLGSDLRGPGGGSSDRPALGGHDRGAASSLGAVQPAGGLTAGRAAGLRATAGLAARGAAGQRAQDHPR